MTISKRDFKHIIYNLNIIIFLHLFMDIYGLGLVAVAALGIIALFIIKNQRK
jgi:hypothetical protein